jgi:hypothetical protein
MECRFRRCSSPSGHLGEKWLRAMDSASSIRREPDVIEHDVHHVERAVRRLRRLNGAQSGTESRMSTFDHALKQLTHRNRLACRAAHQIPRTWRASHPARNQTSHLTGERLCRARPAALKVVIKSAYMESPGSSGGQLSSTGALARAASSERVILRWLAAGRTRLPVVLGARNPGSRVWGVTAGASSPGRRPEPSPAERGHPRP